MADSLVGQLSAVLHVPTRLADTYPQALAFDSLHDLVQEQFHRYRAHIFIAAAGIVVRLIAPSLLSKEHDPAVLVLDTHGRHVISLLSGHLGGANTLALRVAALTGGTAVITTATDNAGAPAIDLLALESGLALDNSSACRHVNAALAEHLPVFLYDPEGWLLLDDTTREFFHPVEFPNTAHVLVTHLSMPDPSNKLLLRPPCLCVGIGCRKGASKTAVLFAVAQAFALHGLALKSIFGLASVEAKRHEPGLLEAADSLKRPLHLFSAATLDAIAVPNPSLKAAQAIGTASVCEAAALLLADGDQLLIEKHVYRNVTIAVSKRSR